MGRKGPRAKTKTVLKPVNKKEQLGGMPKMKKDKNLNKNPPTAVLDCQPQEGLRGKQTSLEMTQSNVQQL